MKDWTGTETDKEILINFLKCGMNKSMTARKMFMHYNTVDYHLKKIYKNNGLEMQSLQDLVKLMAVMGIVDTVEVVRCKDCVYSKGVMANKRGVRKCPGSGMDISDNDYCSYAERRNDGKE